jgi:hypothetical protein
VARIEVAATSLQALRLGRGLFIAKSITEDRSVTWPDEMLAYGAQVLSNETIDLLLEVLPPRSLVTADGPVPF